MQINTRPCMTYQLDALTGLRERNVQRKAYADQLYLEPSDVGVQALKLGFECCVGACDVLRR
jgi:hypothetical protein